MLNVLEERDEILGLQISADSLLFLSTMGFVYTLLHLIGYA